MSARPVGLIAMALCAALSAPAMAQEAPKKIEVKGLKDPELRSFRSVTAGLDTFDEFHQIAPAVPQLRFRLKPRENTLDKTTETVTLAIIGKGEPLAVPIDANGGFTIARNEQAYEDDAELIFNRKRRQFHSLADIRTPGVPGNARRLGDLRLECKVNIAIIKSEIPFLVRATINTLLVTTDWCKKMAIFMSLPGDKELSKATLVYQDRRRELTMDQLHNGYESPMLDPSWPDDTLVELELTKEG